MTAADDADKARAALHAEAVRGIRASTAWVVVLVGTMLAFIAVLIWFRSNLWIAGLAAAAVAAVTYVSGRHYAHRQARLSKALGDTFDAELREFNEGEQ